eukprot:scaffold59771_cov58-Phaeocystis_antarctica.AAC.6
MHADHAVPRRGEIAARATDGRDHRRQGRHQRCGAGLPLREHARGRPVQPRRLQARAIALR